VRAKRALTAVLPEFIVASFVLTVYADTGAVLYELPRPLAVSVVSAAIVLAIAIAVTRSIRRGSLTAATVIGFVVAPLVFLAGLVVAAVALTLKMLGVTRRLPSTDSLTIVLAMVFILSVLRVVGSEAFNLGDLPRISNGNGTAAPRGLDPDIYVILLDGYPRSDTLADFGTDNAWFERALRERGFTVAEGSHTNYPYTWQVLASMFHMAHLDDIGSLTPPAASSVGQKRQLAEAINRSPAVELLDERGYWTVSSGMEEVVGTLRDVDQDIDTGEIRMWERQVLSRTAIWPWMCDSLVIPQHRAMVESAFVAVQETAQVDRATPTFMFAHVMAPHTPIVWAADGEPVMVTGTGGCGDQFHIDATKIGLEPKVFGAALGEQVEYINHRTLAALDTIITEHPDAVVVVLSDHGARYSTGVSDEWFRSFFAARTPGHPGVFDDDARPVELFPTVFNAYFGTDIAIANDQSFTAPGGLERPLDIQPWVTGR
jgi:hypothetical protein